MDDDRSEKMALLRYSVISAALDATLSATERGLIVRALVSRTWTTPDGDERSFSRATVDRWIAAYRTDGLAGLAPVPRTDRGRGRVQREWMAEAVRLRRELPARSAAQITEIIGRAHGVWLAERTVRAHLARAGVSRQALSAEVTRAFGRYEASRRNERWIGDVLVGPFVPHPKKPGSKRAKLFLVVDDYSRLLIAGRFMTEENTRAGQELLRAAVMRRGVPRQLHLDNGAPYRAGQLARTCAVLGIHLVHSKPYAPQGRGKQERLNRYIRERFLTEAEAKGIESFEALNDRFSAWAEQVANTRVHAETGAKPIERFLSEGPPPLPDNDVVREAFRWSVVRRVTKTATVSLLANRYAVDPSLVGSNVELRFDPEDLGVIDVFKDGISVGEATPFVIGRHVHPSVPQAQPPAPAEPTGIDYLGLVAAAEEESQGSSRIAYRELRLPGFADARGTDGDDTDEEVAR
jgi:putative transposase